MPSCSVHFFTYCHRLRAAAKRSLRPVFRVSASLIAIGPTLQILAKTVDLGRGFADHGIASPYANNRGVIATVDGEGHDVLAVWLFDHRGGFELICIDPETGATSEHPVPFDPGHDSPFASLLSRSNRLYTMFNGHFVEFDLGARAFTFQGHATPQMAMAMTEDDRGVIWASTYPNCGLVSFDPATKTLTDYGSIHIEKWKQFPRYLAADSAGWIYVGDGSAASQILTFDSKTRTTKALLSNSERQLGAALVYRAIDGRVYAQARAPAGEEWSQLYRTANSARRLEAYTRSNPAEWLELFEGNIIGRGVVSLPVPRAIVTGDQNLSYGEFRSGRRLDSLDLINRVLVTVKPGLKPDVVRIEYHTEGTFLLGVCDTADGRICGGTMFPMRAFCFDPVADTWLNYQAPGQYNAVTRSVDQMYFGVYPEGRLVRWRPPTMLNRKEADVRAEEPVVLTAVAPTINRPHEVVTSADGRWVAMGGTPGYGLTGGGLLVWDNTVNQGVTLHDGELVKDQSVFAMAALSGSRIIVGTTIEPGSGGEKKATEAELFMFDLQSKQVLWRGKVIPGTTEYRDICINDDGLVYGLAGLKTFFVFDPKNKVIVYSYDFEAEFGKAPSHQQGPQIFVKAPSGEIYALLSDRIVQINSKTFGFASRATSPVPIWGGGACVGGRLYFISLSRLYSWKIDRASGR